MGNIFISFHLVWHDVVPAKATRPPAIGATPGLNPALIAVSFPELKGVVVARIEAAEDQLGSSLPTRCGPTIGTAVPQRAHSASDRPTSQ
jgi:hypothetical protein